MVGFECLNVSMRVLWVIEKVPHYSKSLVVVKQSFLLMQLAWQCHSHNDLVSGAGVR
ncbi:Di- and tricarboxylate transporter [Pseudomonas syringae pv. actinidiae]|uniref:Di-and tricarboxylate transporter n=1 Tax=Pseudomonas syringae pv. actinidiae TaxID=103796 RepID=A0A2V0QNN6_PSESF|nr:Di- and tricarboxylate transporter [Pseudomonas syringae pv. actinidiae]